MQKGTPIVIMIEAHYTIDEAAKILKKKPKSISNLISARQITAIKGRPVLIPESAIKEFLMRRIRRAMV
ncbi:MAG: helix-turn-helix domain-containing protein [Deltaproteobacteria bacterium]|nr:helix-turn-helix domain-containing protein [Deltaproteobacteria bacterium]